MPANSLCLWKWVGTIIVQQTALSWLRENQSVTVPVVFTGCFGEQSQLIIEIIPQEPVHYRHSSPRALVAFLPKSAECDVRINIRRPHLHRCTFVLLGSVMKSIAILLN